MYNNFSQTGERCSTVGIKLYSALATVKNCHLKGHTWNINSVKCLSLDMREIKVCGVSGKATLTKQQLLLVESESATNTQCGSLRYIPMLSTLILLSFIIDRVGVGPTKVLYTSLVSPHLSCMFIPYSLLDLGTLTTQGDPYKWGSSLLCNIPDSCLMSLRCLGIFLSTFS